MAWLAHYGVSKMNGAPGPGSGRYPLGSGEDPWQSLTEKEKKKFIKEYGNLNKYKNKISKLEAENEKISSSLPKQRLAIKKYEQKAAIYDRKAKSPLSYIIPGKSFYDEWRSAANIEKASKIETNIVKQSNKIRKNSQKIVDLNTKISNLDEKAVMYGKDYVNQLIMG